MDHLTLLAPWLLVAAVVARLLHEHRREIRPRAIALEALMVAGAYALYYIVRGITAGDEAAAVANARRIIDLQQALGMYWEPAIQDALLGHRWLIILSNWVYIWWHWPVIIVVAVWLFLARPAAYRLYRDAFLISGAVALVFFATMPVAPPRLSDPDILDTISEYSAVYRSYESPRFVNLYAAFPSLHLGWNVLVSLAVFTNARHPFLRAAAVMSPCTLLFAIVVTGNHFIIDAAAGTALAFAALLAAGAARRLGWRR